LGCEFMAVYIIISLLAFYGLYHLIHDIVNKARAGCKACGGKLCLFPHPGDEGLEGKIRCIFLDEISEKLGTDGYLYIYLAENDPNRSVVEKLCREYPRLVLMDRMNWGRMNNMGDKLETEGGN